MENQLHKVIFKLMDIQTKNINRDMSVLVNADTKTINVYDCKTCELIGEVKASYN